MDSQHTPVLLGEAVAALNIRPDGTYLDATGGLGGHSREILRQLSAAGRLFICDYHAPSAENLKRLFAAHRNVSVHHERFSRIFETLGESFDGILADFGISSAQLADETLGIAFLKDAAPLDMRLDSRLRETAADLLKTRTAEELADLFYNFGGERQSRRIAAAIVHDRGQGRFYETAGELRGLCERVLGRFYRGAKIHPATKVFQGLRIAVNGELEEVAAFVREAPRHLKSGGRLVTISFHEGEDRLAKTVLRELAAAGGFELVTRKAVQPGETEVAANPRARSAKMRVLERI